MGSGLLEHEKPEEPIDDDILDGLLEQFEHGALELA